MTILQEYTESCKKLANLFQNTYYGTQYNDMWAVGDDPTGIWHINDNYYSIQDMYYFLHYNYSIKQMFRYYDYALEMQMQNCLPINIKNWIKMTKKQRQEVSEKMLLTK